MLDVDVATGDLFYGQKRRRVTVAFDAALREVTRRAALRLHEIIATGTTPPAFKEKKCETCSLLPLCLPASPKRTSAKRFFERALAAHLAGTGPETDVLDE